MVFLPPNTAEPLRTGARTRTPRQLQRKRMLDKESQKRKRDQQKAYVLQLEEDLRDARDQVEYLRSVISSMQSGVGRGERHADAVHRRDSDSRVGQLGRPVSTQPESGAMQPESRSFSRNLDFVCRCEPVVHGSYPECFEKTVFNSLITMHRSLAPTSPVPVTPDLADLLFLRDPRDPISKLLHKLLRRANLNSMAMQCAVYILVHRILRASNLFPSCLCCQV